MDNESNPCKMIKQFHIFISAGDVFGNLKAETENIEFNKYQLNVQLLNSISMTQNTLAYSRKS